LLNAWYNDEEEEDMMLMKSLDTFMAKQKDYTRGVEKSLQTDAEAVLFDYSQSVNNEYDQLVMMYFIL
jgi:hypothetical protein